MNETVKRGARSVMDALKSAGLTETTTVVLVGSGARGTMNARSDVDILVISDDSQPTRLECLGYVHLQQYCRSRFLDQLKDGDDYPGWALRFGIPVSDPDGWWAKHVAAEFDKPHWPDWRSKVRHAAKRMNMSSSLLDIGDVDAASEELMFAASHIARATLLKKGVYPLSRPELPAQLKSQEPRLAQLLDRLINENVDASGVQAGHSLLQRQIEGWNVNSVVV